MSDEWRLSKILVSNYIQKENRERVRSHSLPNQERDRSFSLSLWVERTDRKSLGILESEWLKLK
ncbi:hypothetical protein H6F50_25205 [Coleofasciculus sp. FACHB-712]|uniref:hypothetical protein n=1 Tax=Coleofasciculus sp. FACHB-712 TaxID=2692789 RepID=UPI001685F02D|nr:hypothetical protein [Coleofasciculus sp. FACHB-712]MBD1945609.1 hypothetical protein [Coleofasciculus sp. FACHB-712]